MTFILLLALLIPIYILIVTKREKVSTKRDPIRVIEDQWAKSIMDTWTDIPEPSKGEPIQK